MTLAAFPLLTLFKKNRPVEMERAPLAQKLLVCADRVLELWGQLTPHKVEDPSKAPEPGMVILMAPVQGPHSGIFSLAASPGLGTLLAVSATGDPGAGSFGMEALTELCQLLRESLLHDALGLDKRDYLLHSPSPVRAEDLPSTVPSAAVKMLVNGQPLELRLWMA